MMLFYIFSKSTLELISTSNFFYTLYPTICSINILFLCHLNSRKEIEVDRLRMVTPDSEEEKQIKEQIEDIDNKMKAIRY